ncbi:succinate dehydrogenase [bacterium]|nr:succinate dehydrogenase [bacterium]
MAGYLSSSIGRKQIVAVTGLFLTLFLIMHLSGNFLIYKGPDAYNAYAEFLEHLGTIKILARVGLIVFFLTHITFTALLVIDNRKARGAQGYAVSNSVGKRSLATRLMPYTGTLVLAYLLFHLCDYTLADHESVRSLVNGQNLGLYGLVYNSFKNPLRVAFYVLGMIGIGLHLVHAVQSIVQTFGFNHPRYTPLVKKISFVVGVGVAVGFASIPFYMHFCTMSACSLGGY